MTIERVSEKFAFPSKFIEVNGSKMHYVETGSGNPILFLHGIPTSCYLWRNIMPHLSSLGRCIAPDLIGFGKSEKPNIEYNVETHIQYIDKFIENLGLKNITLVMHGWGSVIGFNYAMNHEKNCAGLVFYEAFLHTVANEESSLPYQEQLASFSKNIDPITFVDKMLTQSLMRKLTNEEMQHYKQPFAQQGADKPILDYLRELPLNNEKSKVNTIIESYSKKLTKSKLPKLMLYSVPGFITTMESVMWAKDNLPNLEVVDIGEELHLAQESYPTLISENISVWMQSVEQSHG